jgi:tripartite-type tricarboxylate transporter receptor subunit TctC
MHRRDLVAALAGLLVVPSAARADPFPTRPIRLIVPWPPGGTADITARLLQPGLADTFGQPVVIENRAGAGGSVGTAELVRATADGHTIGIVISSHASNAALLRGLAYDAIRDVTPITNVIFAPNTFAVAAASPLRTLADLVAAAKARPNTLTYATSGNGTAQHIGGARFALMTGTQLVHVPYRGGGPANTATLRSETDFGISNLASIMPLVRDGQVRLLAVAAPQRSALAPEVPTAAEAAAIPGYAAVEWFGMAGPAQMPRPVVDRIFGAVRVAAIRPEAKQRFDTLGADLVLDGPDRFAAFVREQVQQVAEVVREARISLD